MNSLFKEISPNSSSVYAALRVEIKKYQLLYFYCKNLIFFVFGFFIKYFVENMKMNKTLYLPSWSL